MFPFLLTNMMTNIPIKNRNMRLYSLKSETGVIKASIEGPIRYVLFAFNQISNVVLVFIVKPENVISHHVLCQVVGGK